MVFGLIGRKADFVNEVPPGVEARRGQCVRAHDRNNRAVNRRLKSRGLKRLEVDVQGAARFVLFACRGSGCLFRCRFHNVAFRFHCCVKSSYMKARCGSTLMLPGKYLWLLKLLGGFLWPAPGATTSSPLLVAKSALKKMARRPLSSSNRVGASGTWQARFSQRRC